MLQLNLEGWVRGGRHWCKSRQALVSASAKSRRLGGGVSRHW